MLTGGSSAAKEASRWKHQKSVRGNSAITRQNFTVSVPIIITSVIFGQVDQSKMTFPASSANQSKLRRKDKKVNFDNIAVDLHEGDTFTLSVIVNARLFQMTFLGDNIKGAKRQFIELAKDYFTSKAY